VTSVEAQALHRDQLGSVRAVTTHLPLVTGAAITTLRREAAIYKPFGEQTEVLQPTQANQEQKGWIGERYDADAGLQYLNARYYDPELGLFLQPDWFEVTAAGVGTNRYAYAGNDPVNARDPGGNSWLDRGWDAVFGEGSFNSTFSDSGSRWSDRTFGNQFEQDYATFHESLDASSSAGGEPSGSTYDQDKQGFYQASSLANGQAESGDAIFDILSLGAGATR
jgi:RHS repeat-associated protein